MAGRRVKVQRSKKARSEEKALRWLRKMGHKIKIKHMTSHVSGGRAKTYKYAKDKQGW